MNITGIIAEYNPFHNGHAYHIEETRKQTQADYIIAIISGNFVQRGAPAAADKYLRTRLALLGGADLVLELPVFGAVSSAETFAKSGIHILDRLNCVTHISFGAESPDTDRLFSLAALFAGEPAPYRELLSSYLKEGLSFPAARQAAAVKYLHLDTDPSALNLPNNILGIEYLKALMQSDSDLIPCIIPRQGNSYHDTDIHRGFSSATALRKAIFASKELSVTADSLCNLKNQMPDACYQAVKDWAAHNFFLQEDDFSSLLHYKLLLNNGRYAEFGEGSLQLFGRIKHTLEQFRSFSQFCSILKTKDRTYTSIARYLIHLLLGITGESLCLFQKYDCAPYVRILGFKKSATPLLTLLKQSSIPVISRLSSDYQDLSDERKQLLELEIRSAHIYNSIQTGKTGYPVKNEFRRSLIIL